MQDNGGDDIPVLRRSFVVRNDRSRSEGIWEPPPGTPDRPTLILDLPPQSALSRVSFAKAHLHQRTTERGEYEG